MSKTTYTINNLSAEFFTYDTHESTEICNYDFLEEVIGAMTNNTVTSQIAANTLNKKKYYGKLAGVALDHIRNSGPFGMTRGELCERMDKPQNSLTGALKALERMKLIGCTGATRLWPVTGFSQRVYYAKRFLP